MFLRMPEHHCRFDGASESCAYFSLHVTECRSLFRRSAKQQVIVINAVRKKSNENRILLLKNPEISRLSVIYVDCIGHAEELFSDSLTIYSCFRERSCFRVLSMRNVILLRRREHVRQACLVQSMFTVLRLSVAPR